MTIKDKTIVIEANYMGDIPIRGTVEDIHMTKDGTEIYYIVKLDKPRRLMELNRSSVAIFHDEVTALKMIFDWEL